MNPDEKRVFEQQKLIESVKDTEARMLDAMDWTKVQFAEFLGILRDELQGLHFGKRNFKKRVLRS